ncbi:MAG: membrane dipeptidase [Ignavibacterium sp.]|jgi:membrane dipeptidase|nr:membrane dipeptidase [Ignavibacterium sp.]
MRVKLLLLLFAFLNLLTLAQTITITGYVKDLKTNSPIENAKVQIKDLQNGIIDSVFSDIAGNWQYDVIAVSTEPITYLPNDFKVEQNFPNPFNPSTKINFSIPSEGQVTISVHNILGEMINQKSTYLTAGVYTVDWYSKGSAGVYLYTISFGNKSLTKKMIQLDGGSGIGLGEIHSGISKNYSAANKSAVDLEIVVTKFSYAADSIYASVVGGENFVTELQTIHSKYTLIDLHNDVLEVMISDTSYHLKDLHSYNHTDIPRLQIGEVDIQFFSIWVNPSDYPYYFGPALAMRDRFYSELSSNTQTIGQANTIQEALILNNQNKIAGVIGVEGGHHIDNSIDNLIELYNSGMRYLTITWNNSTSWAISANDSRTLTQGLSNFGKEVIRKLDSLGVIIDVSHTGIKTIQDILTITTNPIIASHSGARSIHDHRRNLYDWQIEDIANTGGVIGVVFYPYFLNGSASASIDDVIAHIDHIVNLVGTDYVSLGSDFDGIEVTPFGLEDVSKFPQLTLALLQHGYTEQEVAKFLGGNFKRVFEQVCGN